MILETSRLWLREIAVADAPDMYALNADPDVLQYTGDLPFADPVAAEQFIKNYDHYRRYGYGRWAVLLKDTHEITGWCGLKYHPEEKFIDIGYRFKKTYWNKGIATEAARACLQYGFEHLNLDVITAHAMKANAASIKVMEKIGMQFWKEFMFGENPGVFYKIEKTAFTLK